MSPAGPSEELGTPGIFTASDQTVPTALVESTLPSVGARASEVSPPKTALPAESPGNETESDNEESSWTASYYFCSVRFDTQRRINPRKLIKHYVDQAKKRRRAMSTQMVTLEDFARSFEGDFDAHVEETEMSD